MEKEYYYLKRAKDNQEESWLTFNFWLAVFALGIVILTAVCKGNSASLLQKVFIELGVFVGTLNLCFVYVLRVISSDLVKMKIKFLNLKIEDINLMRKAKDEIKIIQKTKNILMK